MSSNQYTTNHVQLNRAAWNAEAETYQETHYRDLSQPELSWAEGPSREADLQILGDVSDKRILELGCGGAQCSISLTHSGGRCIGLDVSENQLSCGHRLIRSLRIEIPLVLGNAEELPFRDKVFDIVFCVFGAVGFVNIFNCFRDVFRVLRPGGLFAFSWYSPFFNCFPGEGEDQLRVVRSYFDRNPIPGKKTGPDGTPITYIEFHYTMGDWYRALTDAGFIVTNIIEPTTYPNEDWEQSTWPNAPPHKIAMIPVAIIWRARRPRMPLREIL